MRTTVKLGVLLAALVAAVWVTTPEHVRLFDELHGELEGHAEAVRSGAIQPDDDPNRIVRYPVGGGLRKHAVVCIRRGEVLTYSVGAMERPFDGGSPYRHYFVTPYDRQGGLAPYRTSLAHTSIATRCSTRDGGRTGSATSSARPAAAGGRSAADALHQ